MDTIPEENNVTLIGKNVQDQTGSVAMTDSGYGEEALKRAYVKHETHFQSQDIGKSFKDANLRGKDRYWVCKTQLRRMNFELRKVKV